MAAAVEQVTTQIHTFGSAVEIDPGHALLQEVHRSAGHVAWLNVQLEQSSPSCLADNALVGLYRKEREHLVRTCKAALDVGIAEREVRFAEDQGRFIATVLLAALAAAGLTGPQFAEARHSVAEALRSRVTRKELG